MIQYCCHASIEIKPMTHQALSAWSDSAWCHIYRPDGGVQACQTFHRHYEDISGSNALSTILTWAVWTHTCCRPNQNPLQGAVHLLLKEFLPSAHWTASQQQACAQMSGAGDYATCACRNVLHLCAKVMRINLTQHEV